MRFIIYCIVMMLLIQASAQAVLLDRIVAVVNEDVITLSELKHLELTVLKRPESGTEPQRLELNRERLLDELIDKKIKLQKAAKLNVKVSDQEVLQAIQQILDKNGMTQETFEENLSKEGFTWADYRKEIAEQMILSRLINEEIRSRILVMPEELKDFYQENLDRFGVDAKKHLLRIFLSVPESATDEEREERKQEAEALRVRVLSGEDFHQLAVRYSDGPEAKEGGDLGYVADGELKEELNREISGLSSGDISRVLPLAEGFVLFKVTDIRASSYIPFEKIKDQIQEALYQEKLKERYKTWIHELKSNAYIERKL